MFGTGFQPGGGGLDDLASAASGLHQAGEGVRATEDEPQTPSGNGETTPGPHNDEPDGREEEEEVVPDAEQKDPANWPPPDKVKEAKLPMVRLMDKNFKPPYLQHLPKLNGWLPAKDKPTHGELWQVVMERDVAHLCSSQGYLPHA